MAARPQGEDERRRCGGAWCGTVELRVRMNCEREVKNAFSGMHERLVIRHSGPLAWPLRVRVKFSLLASIAPTTIVWWHHSSRLCPDDEPLCSLHPLSQSV